MFIRQWMCAPGPSWRLELCVSRLKSLRPTQEDSTAATGSEGLQCSIHEFTNEENPCSLIGDKKAKWEVRSLGPLIEMYGPIF